MAFGIFYWAVWRIVLPKVFGYELVPNKTVLDDGTVVNVVRLSLSHRISIKNIYTYKNLFFSQFSRKKVE